MILIAGGTGTLGRHLTPLLLARRLGVRVIARHPEAASRPVMDPGIEFVAGDVRDPSALDSALEGVDTVVSAVTGFGGPDALGTKSVDRDGNMALIAAARRAGAGHFVLLSVHDAAPNHPIQLFRDKWTAEEALRASGLSWTIVRPTAYLETWLGIIGGPLMATGRTRIFGRGRNPINFVSAGDVARFVELAIVDPSLGQTAMEVPGPENLTLDELAATVESVTGRVGSKQHLSATAMRAAALVMGMIRPVLGAQIEAARVMDTRDMAVAGPAIRAAYPTIPMTRAADVAARIFGPSARPSRDHVTVS
jgi:uncharacterized protein YbjT (DUF2867 family)